MKRALVRCVAVGFSMLAGAHRPEVDRSIQASQPSVRIEMPVVWVHATADYAPAASGVASVVGVLTASLTGKPIEADQLDAPPAIAWWDAGSAPTSGFQVGLDLNALRASSPDLFDDQRLNDALLALGLANARGVVLEVDPADASSPDGGSARLIVSYRDWDAERSVSIDLSPVSAPGAAAMPGGRVAIRARWADWIDPVISAHRALLDPLRRSPFDAELASWQRRHEQKVRQVAASLEGPIVLGGGGTGGEDGVGDDGEGSGDVMALVGIGSRADVNLLQRNLAIVLGPLGEASFDPRAGVGRVRVGALAGTAFERLEWRVVELERRRWVLVAVEGRLERVVERLERLAEP